MLRARTVRGGWLHRQFGRQHLDGDGPVEREILRQVHGTHAAATKFTKNRVAASDRAFQGIAQWVGYWWCGRDSGRHGEEKCALGGMSAMKNERRAISPSPDRATAGEAHVKRQAGPVDRARPACISPPGQLDAQDLFTREELLAAWRLTAGSVLSETVIVETVDFFLANRTSVMFGDMVGALALQSPSALERARRVWGVDADLSAERVREILRTLDERAHNAEG